MKYVVSVFAFVAGYAVARVVLALFGLSPAVQLLGGVALGYAAAQPMWSYYAKRDAEAVVRGIFGSVAEVAHPAGNAGHDPSSAEVQAGSQGVASRSDEAGGFRTRLHPTNCPSSSSCWASQQPL